MSTTTRDTRILRRELDAAECGAPVRYNILPVGVGSLNCEWGPIGNDAPRRRLSGFDDATTAPQ